MEIFVAVLLGICVLEGMLLIGRIPIRKIEKDTEKICRQNVRWFLIGHLQDKYKERGYAGTDTLGPSHQERHGYFHAMDDAIAYARKQQEKENEYKEQNKASEPECN